MSLARDSTLSDPQQIIADLRQQLATSNAERDEALAQQAATGKILRVISHSTFDLQAVLDALVETAAGLCNADMALMFRREGDGFRGIAFFGLPPAWREFIDASRREDPGYGVPKPGRASIAGRVLSEGGVVHVHDVSIDPEYERGAAVRLGGLRTVVGVPMLRDGEPIGVFTACRQRVEPFTERQIELLRTFADQAVIALENARLITETREALEQQTATAEVLQVINASPGDLAPVFDAILDKAHALCSIALGELELYEDGKVHAVAVRGVTGPFADLLRQPFEPPPGSPPARLFAGEDVVQIADVAELAQQRPDDPRAQAGAQHGLGTALFVPLRKDDALLGYITGYRREVWPFSQKEISLLRNFAAQAVIAIDNTRLITETREALEQQTATAEVLKVINSSPGDLVPVFDAMLEKATRLCDTAFGALWTFDGHFFHPTAVFGPKAFSDFFITQGPRPGAPGTGLGAHKAGQLILQVDDLAATDAYTSNDGRRAYVDLGGARSAISVASADAFWRSASTCSR
jgi:GAF domain-containing protein